MSFLSFGFEENFVLRLISGSGCLPAPQTKHLGQIALGKLDICRSNQYQSYTAALFHWSAANQFFEQRNLCRICLLKHAKQNNQPRTYRHSDQKHTCWYRPVIVMYSKVWTDDIFQFTRLCEQSLRDHVLELHLLLSV